MPDRFAQFPAALASQARSLRLGKDQVPTLLAHPDWQDPAPTILWLHGRTVSKELDPGRYLRWIRAGIAAVAIDLPGHGERLDPDFHSASRTFETLEQVIPEIDQVVEALSQIATDPKSGGADIPPARPLFDPTRLALGGMSAGGMATLRRLCDPHPFQAAAVEATAGNLSLLPFEVGRGARWSPDDPRLAALDPIRHIETWRPIPLLVLHTEADRVVPIEAITSFVDRLRKHYERRGADPGQIELMTWRETGAPQEHSGFGRVSNEAKNLQTQFFRRVFSRV